MYCASFRLAGDDLFVSIDRDREQSKFIYDTLPDEKKHYHSRFGECRHSAVRKRLFPHAVHQREHLTILLAENIHCEAVTRS